jgi:predicted small secreted protein
MTGSLHWRHDTQLAKLQCETLTVETVPARFDLSSCCSFFSGEAEIMSKNFRLAIALAALMGAAPMLSACHTTAGVGQDLSQGGHALTNSADSNAPHNPNP